MTSERTSRVTAAATMTLAMLLSVVATGAEPEPVPMSGRHPTGCGAYDGDIAAELKLLADAGAPVEASASMPAAAPPLQAGKTYRLTLQPQAGVQLAVPPRRRMLEDGAFGGLVKFTVPAAGTWRVSASRETWIEVVGPDGAVVKSSRFQGREGCPEMRKFVEFVLAPQALYTLQLSGGTDATLQVLVSGPVAVAP